MYKIVTLEEVEEQCNDSLLAFDTETKGFYGAIRLAQFNQQHWPEPLLVENPNPFQLAAFLDKQHFFGHTIHYDITTIQEQMGAKWDPPNFDCTFYLSRLFFYTKPKFSLDAVIQYTIGYDPYAELGLDKKKLQKSDWNAVLTEEQYQYAALDVIHLFDVYEKTKPMLDDFNYKLDILFTKNCLDFQWNGMPVLTERLQDRFAKNEAEVAAMNMPINVNSWKQVRPYIGEEESDALALTRFKLQGNTKAGNVLKTRKIIKQNSFLTKFDAEVGRIFGKFLPSARSGRCTSKDQNLEQIPRMLKDIFGVEPDSGRILLYADYSQLELRALCIIVNEVKMEFLYRAGEDVHGHTTIKLIAVNFTPEERHVGKTGNFNLAYGGGAGMLGNILLKEAEILMPLEKLEEFKRNWLKLWPAVNAWQQKGIAAWRRGQPWQTPLGRRYVGNLMTDQLNIQISGFGAEVAKLATHYMSKELGGLTHDQYMLCNFIHDSWIWECDNDPQTIKYLADVIARSMQDAWFECSKATKIHDLPMPVDVYAGFNWGLIEKEYQEKFSYE